MKKILIAIKEFFWGIDIMSLPKVLDGRIVKKYKYIFALIDMVTIINDMMIHTFKIIKGFQKLKKEKIFQTGGIICETPIQPHICLTPPFTDEQIKYAIENYKPAEIKINSEEINKIILEKYPGSFQNSLHKSPPPKPISSKCRINKYE